MTEEKKKFSLGKGCLIVAGVFVGLGVIGAIAGGGEDTAATTKVAEAGVAPGDVAVVEPIEDPADKLTGPQRNALRSAKQYLDLSGFSRKGLIQQLSSNAGDGYAEADAIAAVDSLAVDWKAEAAESAKQYISMTGFSCNGLIEQLSSSAGDKYTKEEAEYGAKQAGAC
ncbi:Ltp family lipoprotein [Novosphingobium sp.]|uniref:Ltp family lipoprotein n=1 Tax=Novosphingobium sp. TaxID=1874826 RepID=UPI00262C74DD|nr:Ltp family lipoprotein [Novosphingobium sp.]